MLTVIAYHPTGYEVRIEVESEKLDTTIRWLEKHSYRPVREMNDKRDPGSHRGEPKSEHPAPAVAQPQHNGRGTKKDNGRTVANINDDLFGD